MHLRVNNYISPLKNCPFLPSLDGALQLDDLLCDHREHFDVDAVELVETSPSSGGSESFEELCESE